AVVVVVSEERGTISFCFSGNIVSNLDGASLRQALLGLFGRKARKKGARKVTTPAGPRPSYTGTPSRPIGTPTPSPVAIGPLASHSTSSPAPMPIVPTSPMSAAPPSPRSALQSEPAPAEREGGTADAAGAV